MNNITDPLHIVHNYSGVNVNGSSDVFDDENYIIEEIVPPDSTTCAPENVHSESENVYIPSNECHLENNISNGVSEEKNLLEKRIIQVISSGNVENIFCIDNVKQEYSVTISDAFQDGSMDVPDGHYFDQPLAYQDLNLIYAENRILHVCDVCGKSFRKKSNLKRHYRSHTGDNPHGCDQCDARFPTMSRLKEHLHAHTGLRPHTCSICGKSFSRVSNLTRHRRTHSAEKPYQCDKCEGRFIEPTRLREHYLTHVGEKRFSCDVCGKCFLKKYNLKRHCRTHTGDHPHMCGICGRGFSKRIYLLVHMETHAKDGFGKPTEEIEADCAIETVASNCVVESVEDQDCIVHLNSEASVEDIYSCDVSTNDQENKIFSCKQCSRHYIKESSLLSHMKRHEERDPLSCDVCAATFTHASRLREHSVTHSGERLFACAVCKRRFGRNSNLLRHLQTHTGERRFSCGVCARRFGSNDRLREHLMSHTGEKPHDCNVCGKPFRHKFGLQRHLLLHTGEKPHKCNACGKRFSRRGRLSTHCERHHAPGEAKFPNRVEPRLMNIIQNLEARLCEPIETETDSQIESSIQNKSNRIVKEGGLKVKNIHNRKRKTHSETCNSSEELQELTVEITTADPSVGDSSPILRNLSFRKCAKKIFTKTGTRSCRAKFVQSELRRRNKNLLKRKSREDLSEAVGHHSKRKTPTKQTLKSNVSKLDSFETFATFAIPNTSESIDEIESFENNVGQVSEQIEIDDVSAYQTQVIGNDLDTIVLIKAAL